MPEDGNSPGHFLQLEEEIWGSGVTELRRLCQLEDENIKLKQLVADLSLDKHMLQDVLKKSFKASPIEGAGRSFSGQLQSFCTQDL